MVARHEVVDGREALRGSELDALGIHASLLVQRHVLQPTLCVLEEVLSHR